MHARVAHATLLLRAPLLPRITALPAAAACPCRKEAGTIGDIYLALVGEFGRSVGAGLGAIETLTRGSLASLNPLVLGADALQAHIDTLITFLQGAVDASVASPDKVRACGQCTQTLHCMRVCGKAAQTCMSPLLPSLLHAAPRP